MSALREFQRVFADSVRGTSSTGALEARVAGADPRARVEVYRTAYVSRLCDVLREDYPKVAAALGDRFHGVATEYVGAHPSDHPSLRHFGRHLPEFLEWSKQDGLPWLADLARLEWARVGAFDAGDAMPVRFDELRALPDDDWRGLRLVPMPSLTMLRLAWDVCEVWSALEDERTPASSRPDLTTAVVWRSGFVVRHRICPPTEARAVALLQKIAPFSTICEAFAESSVDGIDDAASQAFSTLTQWVADEWIRGPLSYSPSS
jgi:hypothetical protein